MYPRIDATPSHAASARLVYHRIDAKPSPAQSMHMHRPSSVHRRRFVMPRACIAWELRGWVVPSAGVVPPHRLPQPPIPWRPHSGRLCIACSSFPSLWPSRSCSASLRCVAAALVSCLPTLSTVSAPECVPRRHCVRSSCCENMTALSTYAHNPCVTLPLCIAAPLFGGLALSSCSPCSPASPLASRALL